MSYAFFSDSGKIKPIREATVPLGNIEYAYGFGVYETLKVRHGYLYFPHDHIERLMLSAQLIALDHSFTADTILQAVVELIRTLQVQACNIKIQLIGGKTKHDAFFSIFDSAPLYPNRKLYRTGASVITKSYERYLPQAKSLNMLPSYLFYREATSKGCYDALLIDRNNCIREGTRTNFFCIKGTTIVSPPREHILEGVTRRSIITMLESNGYTYIEKPINLETLSDYDGAFLSSTSTKIMPILQVDSFYFSSIPAELFQLMNKYDAFLENCVTTDSVLKIT